MHYMFETAFTESLVTLRSENAFQTIESYLGFVQGYTH